MKNKFYIILFSLLLILLSCSSNKAVLQQNQEDPAINQYKIKAAISAAEEWLELLDSGSYKQCYEISAELLKNAVTKESLSQSLATAVEPLGKLSKRTLIASEYFKVLPGAPEGEYVVLQFSSHSENSKNVVETITPMLDEGVWKVSGYYIH
jgi:hypothetical protein